MRKKFILIFLAAIFVVIIGYILFTEKDTNSNNTTKTENSNTANEKKSESIDEKLKKSIVLINSDKDKDGIKDQEDIVIGARKEADKKIKHISNYYVGGYPPDNEGMCADLVWRAFKDTGYNLKDMVNEDIRNHPKDYATVEGKRDPNIDFRKVPILYVYFKKYGTNLTTELKPDDLENLKQWQPGDIITFEHSEHIAVVSDKRRSDGVPYIIYNAPPYARECDEIMYLMPKITGHFRFPKQ